MSGSGGIFPNIPTNPHACGILGLLQTASAFESAALNLAGTVVSSISAFQTALPGLIAGLEESIQAAVNAAITSVLTTAATDVAAYKAYLVSQLAGLVNNLGLAATHLAAQAGLTTTGGGCNLPASPTNPPAPCDGLSQFFGLLLGGANSFMDTISGTLAELITLLNAASTVTVAAVEALMATISAAVSAVSSLVATETALLASMLSDLLNFATMNSLLGLANNQCASAVLASLTTPQMAAQLGI